MTNNTPENDAQVSDQNDNAADGADAQKSAEKQPKEIGGQKGPEPTRYGDWEKNGIISDF